MAVIVLVGLSSCRGTEAQSTRAKAEVYASEDRVEAKPQDVSEASAEVKSKRGSGPPASEETSVDLTAPEDLMKATLALMEEMIDVLSTVADETSARAAVPALHRLSEKGDAIKKRFELAKTKMTTGEQNAIREKYDPNMRALLERLQSEVIRISSVPGAAEALRAQPQP